MRYASIVLILCVCGVARGQDAAPAPVSVLNHGKAAVSTSAPAPAPAAAPAPVTVSAAPVQSTVVAAPVVVASKCRNGRCCTGPQCQLYNVEESNSESCRKLLFGGYVKKNTSRTVYRPSRR
jgi:hypothetical protein